MSLPRANIEAEVVEVLASGAIKTTTATATKTTPTRLPSFSTAFSPVTSCDSSPQSATSDSSTNNSLQSLLDAANMEHQRLETAPLKSHAYTPPQPMDSDVKRLGISSQPTASSSPSTMSIASLIHTTTEDTSVPMLTPTTAATFAQTSPSSISSDATWFSPHQWAQDTWSPTATATALTPPASEHNSCDTIESSIVGNRPVVRALMDHLSMGLPTHISPSTMTPHSSTKTPLPKHVLSASRASVTRVTCWYAAVAQKSYGSEKRFLCPPPVVRVDRSLIPVDGDGVSVVNEPLNKPQLSMTVVCEQPLRELVQKSLLDEKNIGSFKYLHVAGTEKAKQFSLRLKLFDSCPTPLATFDSTPISIISKPSKKTVKARNITTCIFDGGMVSLFNRINSQTVRTRYLDAENGRLCAKNSRWTAFTIHRLCGGSTSETHSTGSVITTVATSMANGATRFPITYGSTVVLSDPTTGTRSDPLIIRKVERGRIIKEAVGPVSQMQKIALQHAYPVTSTTPILTDSENPSSSAPTRYLCAGYDANIISISDQLDPDTRAETIAAAAASPFLTFARSRSSSVISTTADTTANSDTVDDYLCWTIVGLAKFEHTFGATGDPYNEPINSYPGIVGDSSLDLPTRTLCLSISNWLTPATQQTPMEIWINGKGPLPTSIIRTSEQNISLIEVVLPNLTSVWMDKKKESTITHEDKHFAGVDHDHDYYHNGGTSSNNNSSGSELIPRPTSEGWILPGPLHLVRADGIVYQLASRESGIHCRLTEELSTYSTSTKRPYNNSVGSSRDRVNRARLGIVI